MDGPAPGEASGEATSLFDGSLAVLCEGAAADTVLSEDAGSLARATKGLATGLAAGLADGAMDRTSGMGAAAAKEPRPGAGARVGARLIPLFSAG